MKPSEPAATVATTRLTSPRFASFLLVQFLGAFNDNAFKTTLSLFLIAHLADESAQLRFASLTLLLFPVPFLVFSPLAGFLADRYGKSRMIRLTKLPEPVAMVLAVVGFAVGSPSFLLLVLFVMATQSAFFSPAKYGLLPESLEARDLSMGNGLLQMTTNLAILVGTTAGVVLFERFSERLSMAGWIFVGVAAAGVAAAFYVPRTPPGNTEIRFLANPLRSFRRDWTEARGDPALFQSLLGITFFWLLGSIFLTVIPVFGHNHLGTTVVGSGLMLTALSVGIAVGSLLAGPLSRNRVELGLVPLGSLGLTCFALDLAVFGHLGRRIVGGVPLRAAIDLGLLGLSAGLFIVPLNALLQQRSPAGGKGRMIAFANVLAFMGVLLAGAVPWALSGLLGWSSRRIVLASGLFSLLVTIYIVSRLPQFLVRLVLYLLTNTIYRVRVVGEARLPHRGALLVANHVSWADALLIGAASDRMVRFLMFRPFYEAPALNWFFRRMRVIPIASGDSAEQKETSLDRARQEIAQGHLVCIFAEGSITRTGNLLKFKRGFERIAEGTSMPIVPVLLDGVWGSIFSYRRGRIRLRLPRRLLAPVRVIFGEPLPASTRAFQVRERIQELSVEAFRMRKAHQQPLQLEFVRRAGHRWRRPFVYETHDRRLLFGQALVRALALRRSLFPAGERRRPGVGILLPPGITGTLANLAVLCNGSAVANLDPEASEAALRTHIASAGLDLVLTSRAYLDALRSRRPDSAPGWDMLATAVRLVDVEAAEQGVSRPARLGIWLACRLLPSSVLRRAGLVAGQPHDVDATAALVRAVRSPEGPSPVVVLSHHNILSNIESLRQIFRLTADDRLLGVVALASPFGLTHTLLLPAIAGIPVVCHADPEDGTAIGELLQRRRVSLVPVASQHLSLWTETAGREAFDSVQHVVTTGEGLTDELRERLATRLDVKPLVAFGRAECSPLISINAPRTMRRGRSIQTGNVPGTSGHPLPGVAVRIVEPDSCEPLPPERQGVLWVKGASVMHGYLDDPEATRRVLHDGWFDTGQRAVQDANGFLTVDEG